MHSPSGVSRQNVWIEKKHQVSSCIKSQKTGKEKKRQLKVIQEKRQSSLTVDDLLSNSIIEVFYQISGNCYYYIY